MLLWRKHPNGGRIASVAVPRSDSRRLLERGWLKIDGCRAEIVEFLGEEDLSGMDELALIFDEPYPFPHP